MAGNRDIYNLKMNQGNDAAWENDWPTAIKFYSEALREFPEDIEAHIQLGMAMIQIDRLELAIQVFERAHQLAPDDPLPLEKRADVLEKLGRLKEAAQEYINGAELYFQEHDLDKAIRGWDHATQLMPGLVDIHAKLAQVYEHLGEKNQAIRQYLIVASNFQQQGDYDNAAKAAQRALSLDPHNPSSLNAIRALQSGASFMLPPEKKRDLSNDFFAASSEENGDEQSAEELLSLLEDLEKPLDSKDEMPSEPSPEVLFSAYFPFQGEPNTRYSLIVYAHIQDAMAQIVRDVQKFREELGGAIRTPKTAKQTARLKIGTLVTITPECDEFEIEPAAVTKKWNGDWTRYDFDFKPTADLMGEIVIIRVSIAVSGIEIAHINCPIEIAQKSIAPVNEPVKNPLAAAKMTAVQSKMYQRVFISYSRRDKAVVEAYRLAQLALGNDVFMDTYSIRVGENWQAALARAIDEADIFQLFWSEPASQSDNIRDEWDYALNHKCPDTQCESFIRPVFWEQPMPIPPRELVHLNFRYVPLTAGDNPDSKGGLPQET
jgi:tetratricopeptide (TPR) repeat protein